MDLITLATILLSLAAISLNICSNYTERRRRRQGEICPRCNDVIEAEDWAREWCKEHGCCRMCCLGEHPDKDIRTC